MVHRLRQAMEAELEARGVHEGGGAVEVRPGNLSERGEIVK